MLGYYLVLDYVLTVTYAAGLPSMQDPLKAYQVDNNETLWYLSCIMQRVFS